MPVDDPDLRLGWGGGHERRLTHQHLVHDHADRPPITQLGVSVPPEDFGGNVVGGADEGVSDAAVVVPHATELQRFHRLTETLVVLRLHAPLSVVLPLRLVVLRIVSPPESRAEAEIGQLDVSVRSDQDVVGFDVSVDEPHSMDGLNGTDQLGDVEQREVLGKGAQLDEKAHHVSSGDVLHHKVEILAVLEREEELHHPFVVSLCENISFRLHVGHLVPSEYVHFSKGLHGVQLLRVSFSHERYNPECPQSERF